MEKRSSYERYSKPKLDRVNDDKPPVIEEVSTVRLVLLRNVILKYTGKVTGRLYTFPGAGSVVEVDIRDADQMLQKGINMRSCCSGAVISPYFKIAEA